MKSVFALFLLVMIFLSAPAFAQAPPQPAPTEALESLASDFWAWRAKFQPFSTDDIPRIEHPGGVRDWSAASIEKQRKDLAAFESRWKQIDPSAWPILYQVDYRLIGSALARVRWELDVNARWHRDPSFYVEQSLTAVLEALVVPGPFNQSRSREILGRIENIPSLVKQGEENLRKPPAPFAKVAIALLADAGPRLQKMAAALRPETTLTEAELSAATDRAAQALEQFRQWLEQQLPNLPAETAVGRDAYVFFLRNVALLPYTPEQITAMGRQEWERTVSFEQYELQKNAGLPPLSLVADTDAWTKKCARDEACIRQFLEQRGILSVPTWVSHYALRPMPEYVKALSPFGEADDFTSATRLKESCTRYINPPSSSLGFFWLATAKDTRPILTHEGVPGHYFQLALSWANKDSIRRHYYDSGANEGIGFYAEEMMLQSGLFDDSPRTREIIYSFMRLRALRVEVDVKLALGQFTLEQAADYLEHTVPMDHDTAREEATLFATTPGQAISYQIGKIQILRFLADAKMRQGSTFNLRNFHDSLWTNGNVPIALQRWEYLGLRDDLDRVDSK